jgi:hypothetical protein
VVNLSGMDAEAATVQLLLIERLKDKEAECAREHAAAAAALAERSALAAANLELQGRVDAQDEKLRLLAGETAALQAKLKQREQFAEAGMIASIQVIASVQVIASIQVADCGNTGSARGRECKGEDSRKGDSG